MAADAQIKIPAELFALAESSHFEGDLVCPSLVCGADELTFDGPLSWEVDVTNTDGALLVMGAVQAQAHVMCARCLDDVAMELDGQIEGWFLMNPEDVAPDFLEEDEIEVLPADHIIDLEPLIKAALILEIPNPPLCSDDCKGLCPQCGANLNEGDCGCGADAALEDFNRAANPFAALADYDFGAE